MPSDEEYAIAEQNWDAWSTTEKLDFLTRVVRDTLSLYGFDPNVRVEARNLAANEFGAYYGGNPPTIVVDLTHLQNQSFWWVVDTALHETAHAMQDQLQSDGGPYTPGYPESEAEDFASLEAEELMGLEAEDDLEQESEAAGNDLSTETSSRPDDSRGAPTRLQIEIDLGRSG